MKSTAAKLGIFLLVIGGACVLGIPARHVAGKDPAGTVNAQSVQRPYGIDKRTPWTKSRVTGTPEPPPPFKSERAFPKLQFINPLLLARAPGIDRFFIGEQVGKLYSFRDDPAVAKADLFIDLTTELKSIDPAGPAKGVEAVYGLTFHPQFAQNRYCYICYVLKSKKDGDNLADGTRVSRFTVTKTDPPRCDPKSEKVLITFLAGGHNGGCLEFGNDGMLYISTGDGAGPNPPDGLDTGQDLTDLLSSILRINVDHPAPGKGYAVPPDNPFLKTPGARPEIWAYGFRNPWKMSFDRATGDLWVGDVGWELWEMVYRVQKGGNYGWSVMEGRQPVKPEGRRGPTPILPPALDFPHSEAASITGGFVYRGKRFADLRGAYICGDWVTGKVWASRFDGDKVVSHREVARTGHHIVAWGEDKDGEQVYVHYDEKNGTIHRLVPNDVNPQDYTRFPRKLSETGLFASTATLAPEAGVIPFSINAEMWADHATAERLVALPNISTVTMYDAPASIPGTFFTAKQFFPKDAVLAKTISLEMEQGKPSSRRRIETQILHLDGREWHGYSYQWNDAQTDATLVDAAGAERTFSIPDPQYPGGRRTQTWRFHSRAECLRCHNPWTGFSLAFNAAQLDKEHNYGGVVDHQLRTLQHLGIITPTPLPKDQPLPELPPGKLVNPHDQSADLTLRARSYFHVNCSHCHQIAAGGATEIDLRCDLPLEQTKALEVRPLQGTFNIPSAQVLSPGDPYRSVLYYRMAKLGGGRMPHIGSEIVDEQGLRLIHDWIRRLPVRTEERVLVEKLRDMDEATALVHEAKRAPEVLKQLALDIAGAAGRQTPTDQDRQEAAIKAKAQAALRVKDRATGRVDVITRLLGSTSGALLLAQAVEDNRLPPPIRQQVFARAVASADANVRDILERFVPESQRVKRLGNVIKPEKLLAMKGDAARGKALFFDNAALQCKNCHRIAGVGSSLGPDLTQIAKKLDRTRILESILEPSKSIEPQYVAYLVETKDGQVFTGLLAEKSAKQVVLKNVGDKETRIPADKVVTVAPSRTSIMPELLLRDMTAEQVANLLAYLESLK